METHVKVVGWLHIALSALVLLGAAIVFLAVFGGGLISGDHTAILVTFLVSAIVGGLLVVIAAPGLIAGIGLLKFKPWARILALVLSVFNLVNFPFGTLLGIYTFIVLLSEEGDRFFTTRPNVAGSAVAAPVAAVSAPEKPAVTTVLPAEPPAASPTVPAPEPPAAENPASEPPDPLPPAI